MAARAGAAIIAAAAVTSLSITLAPAGLAAGARRATVSVQAPSQVVKKRHFNVVVSGRPKRTTLLLVFYDFRHRTVHCTARAQGEFARGAGVLAHGIAKHRFRVVARRLYSSKAGTVTYCGYLTRSVGARPDARTRATTRVVPR
jgi:hypothetical protein